MDSIQFLIIKYQIIWTSKLDNVEEMEEFNDLLFQEQDSLNDVKFSVQTELLLKKLFRKLQTFWNMVLETPMMQKISKWGRNTTKKYQKNVLSLYFLTL